MAAMSVLVVKIFTAIVHS
uniref:Uncharacterized protein n=1 Tax=Anguilla anguilla TaxID=7936 RepID=A0A0E9QG28_ANGAN